MTVNVVTTDLELISAFEEAVCFLNPVFQDIVAPKCKKRKLRNSYALIVEQMVQFAW